MGPASHKGVPCPWGSLKIPLIQVAGGLGFQRGGFLRMKPDGRDDISRLTRKSNPMENNNK